MKEDYKNLGRTMSTLSPAAQAVLDAYADFEAANIDAMAAALRAVAGQLSEKTWGDGSEMADGMRSARHHLEGIAAELSNVATTSQEV